MDELPAMQLTEALLDGLANAFPLHEQDFDVFALDALDLDDDLALPEVDSALGCAPAQQQGNVPASQPAAQRNNEAHRVERMRARNREAQARYRQKAKVSSSRIVCETENVYGATLHTVPKHTVIALCSCVHCARHLHQHA